MAARNTVTIEFVGDTARLVRASDKASDTIRKDMRDAGDDVEKTAKSMADRFEDAFGGIHGRVGTRVGPGFASLGGKLGGKLVAGFAAIGVGAVISSQFTESMDITAGVDKLEARLGLTAKEAGRIGERAGATYAGAWGDSMEEVQGFYAETMRAFPKLTDDALQKVTESAATTADVWDQDFNEVVRSAQQLLINGLAPDAQTAMDMVATALQKTKGPQDEVLQALDEYSTSFGQLGLDGSNILGALTSEWATNQYAIDKVGDAVKELGIRTLDGSDTTKEGLDKIGLSVGEVEAAFAKGGETAGEMTTRIIEGITGIEDPAERARVGVALMGTPFEDLGKNAVPILDDVVEGQEKLTDTVEVGNKAYDNAKTKIESWRRQGLQRLTEFIGGSVIPALEDDLVPAVAGVGDAFGEARVAATGDARRISGAVADYLGVRVPDDLNRSGKSFDVYADRIETARKDGVSSFRELWDLINAKNLTAGQKFGIAWADIWADNTKTEQRNLDTMFALFSGQWVGKMFSAGARFGDGMRARFSRFWQRESRDLSVRLFVLHQMWSNWTVRVRRTVEGWGSRLTAWFGRLPGRIVGSLGDVGKRIKDAFMRILGGGLSIPIKLAFGGDGLGIGALADGGGGVMGAAGPVVAAYRSIGSPGGVISGFRPGARTLSGNLSWHARRRALDFWPGTPALAAAIISRFGSVTKELITPWPGLGIHNGRRHRYSDAVQAQHDGRTNVRHFHWAMGRGGMVNKPGRFLVGDSGIEIVNLARGDMVTPLDKMGGDGFGIVARQILRHVQRGGQIFEDLTWRGAPRRVGRYNDRITDAIGPFLPRGFDFGDAGTRRHLARALKGLLASREPSAFASHRRGGDGPSAPGRRGQGPSTVIVNVYNARSAVSKKEMIRDIREAIRNAGGVQMLGR